MIDSQVCQIFWRCVFVCIICHIENIQMMIYILTHIFKHPSILSSILAKLKGFICHVIVPSPKSFGYLDGMSFNCYCHHWTYRALILVGYHMLFYSRHAIAYNQDSTLHVKGCIKIKRQTWFWTSKISQIFCTVLELANKLFSLVSKFCDRLLDGCVKFCYLWNAVLRHRSEKNQCKDLLPSPLTLTHHPMEGLWKNEFVHLFS